MSTIKKNHVSIEMKVKKGIRIPFPYLILSIVVMLLYSGSLNHGFTELDDTIFVNEFHEYNSDANNLVHSFKRGVFSEDKDFYYRPMLLNSFIVNTWFAQDNIKAYFFFNILLHLIAVLLLYILLQKLNVGKLNAFLLSLIFGVHPALTQAVAWIPGRNDTLLAVFAFAGMIAALHYTKTKNPIYLIAQCVLFLLAFFTKETAVLTPFALLSVLYLIFKDDWKKKEFMVLYVSWILCAVIWWLVRSQASLIPNPVFETHSISDMLARMPIAIQYIGKSILPFNLSVFPMMNQTTYWFGALGLVLIGLALYFAKNVDKRIVIAGIVWFVLLLLPVFLLPSSINDQDFEHRLYLPILGILLVLSQTWFFKNLSEQYVLIACLIISIVFALININQQNKFSSPLNFWQDAVRTSPQSSYANMMLAARIDSMDVAQANRLMKKAYALNPKEKYINYYLGKHYLEAGKLDSAKLFLLDELKLSAYYDTYFLLSRLSFLEKNTAASISYMETYLEKDPKNSQAINNLVLMLVETNQKEKAKNLLLKKQAEGIAVNQGLMELTK